MSQLDFDAVDKLITKLGGITAGLECVVFGLDGNVNRALDYFVLELEEIKTTLEQSIITGATIKGGKDEK
ncbi:hypothetical protein KRX11_01100 [Pasteurellaceae bacterium TAE3-ERU1]|nr:hypothetical protein [Pasteurellaceae bacterium TAE3-ERU1]